MPSSHSSSAVRMTGVRILGSAEGAELAESVPHALASIAAILPRGAITVRAGAHGAEPDVVVDIHTDTRPEQSTFTASVTEILTPIAEIEVISRPRTDISGVRTWPLVPDVPGRPIGFDAPDTRRAARWGTTEPWGVFAAQTDELTGLLARHPSIRYVVTFEGADPERVSEEEWLVRPRLESDDDYEIPLSVRAAIRRAFPGFHVSADPEPHVHPLHVERDGVSALVRIPVAIGSGVAGMRTAPTAAIPLQRLTTAGSDTGADTAPIRIGEGVSHSGRPVDVELTARERLRHVHVLGRTGTGKSTLVASLAQNIAATNEGFVVLDPHTTLVDRILAELPESALDRAWVIRAGDIENLIRINSLAVEDDQLREMAIMEINEIFQEMFDPQRAGIVGPRFMERVAYFLRALHVMSDGKACLLDVPMLMTDTKLVDSLAASDLVTDPRLSAFLRQEPSLRRSSEHGELNSWISSKFTSFDGTPAMRGILGTGENSIDWTAAMDSGRIILVDLSKAELGETSSRLLGFLLLNSLWLAALRRQQTTPFTVFVDEVQSFSSGTLPDMLSEGRKFGLSVVLAHQYLGQLDPKLRTAIDGNVGTTVAFGCAASDAPEISARFGGALPPSAFATLPSLGAVTMRTAGGVAPTPFSVLIDHNERVAGFSEDHSTRNTDIVTRRTHRDLVDPFRDAMGLFDEPRASEVRARIQDRCRAAAVAPTPSRPTPTEKGSFLDDWLAAREAKRTEAPTDPPD